MTVILCVSYRRCFFLLNLCHSNVTFAAGKIASNFDTLREIFGNIFIFDTRWDHHLFTDLARREREWLFCFEVMNLPSSRRVLRWAIEQKVEANQEDEEFH